jgi:hypothetical protein
MIGTCLGKLTSDAEFTVEVLPGEALWYQANGDGVAHSYSRMGRRVRI